MNTITSGSRDAITVFDADVAASATVHGNAWGNSLTGACAIELHVTLSGSPPAALKLNVLGQLIRPANDTDRLLPLSVSVPDLSNLTGTYTGVFLLPALPFNQIEIQNTGGVGVHVTAYAIGSSAQATADDAASSSGSGGSGTGTTPHQAASVTLVAAASVFAAACTLGVFTGYNADSATRYVQIHDKASAIAPGDTPVIVIPVPANRSLFAVDVPYKFTNGMQVGISTTETTYTSAGNMLAYSAVVYS